jgi:hypothetical protein
MQRLKELPSISDLDLESFYSYGYKGRPMFAVRAPFATTGEAPDIVGRIARIAGRRYEIVAISRQISGPIAKGEPIGVEVRAVTGAPSA